MKFVKNILLSVLMGATVVTVVLTILVAYSDRVNPSDHQLLACAGMAFPFFLLVCLLLLVVWLVVSWRRSWVVLLGLLLIYPAIRTYIPLHLSTAVPEGSIKVLSYNVAGYTMVKKHAHPQDTIIGYLKQQDADIVCLQESFNAQAKTEQALAAMYPYNDTVHVNRPTNPLINCVGIHSRYPIVRKERIAYKSVANGSVAFFLQIGEDTVIVVNNHLESTHLSSDDRLRYQEMIGGGYDREQTRKETRKLLDKLGVAMALRAPQAQAVHNFIESHRQYPIIVCGDFNDTPISYTRRTIAEGLTDCFVESGNGLGISFNQEGFYFRIDHILCSSHYKPYGCMVDNKMDASDHYPISCWLQKTN